VRLPMRGVILRIFSIGRARIFQGRGACAPRRTVFRLGRTRRGLLGAVGLAVLAAAFGPLVGCKSEKPGQAVRSENPAVSAAEPPTPAPTLEGGKTTLGDILVNKVTQQVATPQLNLSINKQPLAIGGQAYKTGFGTAADSQIEISFPAKFETFSGACGIDDEVSTRGGSIICKILDGTKVLFASPPIKAGTKAADFSVPVKGRTSLTLIVNKAGPTNDSDHADWVNLNLK
jgi:NPCBM/NEW2 domain-containing protein